MTVLTMKQLELLVGEGSCNEQAHTANRHVPVYEAPLRQKTTRERIYEAVAKSDGAVTRAQIAKAVGIRKSTWLCSVIEGLVSDGYLHRTQSHWVNGVVMFWYEAVR